MGPLRRAQGKVLKPVKQAKIYIHKRQIMDKTSYYCNWRLNLANSQRSNIQQTHPLPSPKRKCNENIGQSCTISYVPYKAVLIMIIPWAAWLTDFGKFCMTGVSNFVLANRKAGKIHPTILVCVVFFFIWCIFLGS